MARRDSESLGPSVGARAVLGLCAFVVVLGSCATAPRGAVAERDELSALGGGASVYLRLDTEPMRPVLNAVEGNFPSGGNARRTAQLIDRTDSAAIALFGSGSPRRYLVAARGRYPVGSAALSLALNSEWKKVTSSSGKRYWRSGAGVSLAFGRDSALISDGEPFSSGVPPARPSAYSSELEAAPLSGWVSDPPAFVSGLLGQAGSLIRLPIEELAFALLPGDADRFVFESRLVAASPERARAMGVLLNLARTAVLGDSSATGRLLALLLPPKAVLEGRTLILRSSPMTREEIALLCASVSIHLSR